MFNLFLVTSLVFFYIKLGKTLGEVIEMSSYRIYEIFIFLFINASLQ